MPEFLTAFIEKYSNMSIAKKLGYPLAIGTLIMVMGVVSLWMRQPDYKVLFSSLSETDASKVMQMLESKHIPYKLAAGGTVIRVPSEQVYQLRLLTVGEGMITDGVVGYEIFDKSAMGVTEFVQKVNLKRAMQGELSRTIKSLTEIEDARVHLVVPEKRLFSNKKETSSASIVLKMARGKVLTESQVNGIVMLVAGSVEGINSDNVTVIDSQGNVISKRVATGGMGEGTSDHFSFQQKFEMDMNNKLESMLEKFVGSESVVVRTTALINFKNVQQTEEKFDPDLVAVRSEQKSQESMIGGKSTGGVPGVASNVPGGESAIGGQQNNQKKNKKSQTINYEVTKTLSTILIPAGSVDRLSVAVLVDGNYEAAEGDAVDVPKKFIPRSEEEMANIKRIVEKAMGFDAERGDQLEVLSVPFKTSIAEVAFEPPTLVEQLTAYMPIARLTLFTIILLVIFFAGVKPMVKDILSQKIANVPQVAGAGGVGGIGVDTVGAEVLQFGKIDKQSVVALSKEEILKISKENPKQTAMLLKQWLND